MNQKEQAQYIEDTLTGKKPDGKFSLTFEAGETGLIYVTSPDLKGLLATGRNFSEALLESQRAIYSMLSAILHKPEEKP